VAQLVEKLVTSRMKTLSTLLNAHCLCFISSPVLSRMSLEALYRSVSRDIRYLYGTHRSIVMLTVPSHLRCPEWLINTITCNILRVHFNIILLHTASYSKLFLPFIF
jgi:hypothetical protein